MTETITIERMVQGPEGVGHLESGKTVFVGNVTPGDVVEVEITEDKPTYAKARAVKLVEASPERARGYETLSADPAQLAMAPWAQLSYKAQLKAKEDNVANALLRTAHLPKDKVAELLRPIEPCKREWGYRNKLEFNARPDNAGRLSLGVNAEGTHDFISLKDAPLGNSKIRKSSKALQGALRYLCGQDDLGIFRVGIRGSEKTDSVEVALWTPPSSFPRSFAARVLEDSVNATSIVRVIADKPSSRKVKRVEVLGGEGYWREQMTDATNLQSGWNDETFDFRISAPSFFQVNTAQAQKMVGLVLEALPSIEGARIADLYSGAGTFSFPLVAAGADVTAIELEGSSSRDFKRNAEINGLYADIICDDVARALPSLRALDAIVVDPPRAGLDKSVIGHIASASPQSIVYVSCDVQTFARDVERLERAGYTLRSVAPIDMFTQTYHVECVGSFVRA